MSKVTLLITKYSDGSLYDHAFVVKQHANSWDLDHKVAEVQVPRELYEVMCGQMEEWFTLQDTLDELLQEKPQT